MDSSPVQGILRPKAVRLVHPRLHELALQNLESLAETDLDAASCDLVRLTPSSSRDESPRDAEQSSVSDAQPDSRPSSAADAYSL